MRKLIILSLCVLMLVVVPLQAGASSNDSLLSSIVSLHGNGLTVQELRQEVAKLAASSGKSEMQVTDEIYRELKSHEAEFSTSSSGGGGGEYQLDTSTKGYIFYQPASTWVVINHGHTGIYYSSTEIVEAANPDDGVRKAPVSTRKVDSGAKIQFVKSTSTTQDTNAANWASNRVGNSYNNYFFSNKSCGDKDDYNCSQLVWCAFKTAANLDLDSDGGYGVYPRDIRDSNLVGTVKTY